MSKKKERKGRERASNTIKKAVSTTVIAGALLLPASAEGKDNSTPLSVGERIARVQQAIKNRLSSSDAAPDGIISKASSGEPAPAQWGNYWTNWNNWGNWGNWANWNNWGNWANWNNWGNF